MRQVVLDPVLARDATAGVDSDDSDDSDDSKPPAAAAFELVYEKPVTA